jgi:hypothetical protein
VRSWLPGILAALGLVGCSPAPTLDDDTSAADDDDTTTGACDGIAWGPASAFDVGEPVGNWSLHGYVDTDGDGAVERAETPFTLQDIQCRELESLVVVVGDTT